MCRPSQLVAALVSKCQSKYSHKEETPAGYLLLPASACKDGVTEIDYQKLTKLPPSSTKGQYNALGTSEALVRCPLFDGENAVVPAHPDGDRDHANVTAPRPRTIELDGFGASARATITMSSAKAPGTSGGGHRNSTPASSATIAVHGAWNCYIQRSRGTECVVLSPSPVNLRPGDMVCLGDVEARVFFPMDGGRAEAVAPRITPLVPGAVAKAVVAEQAAAAEKAAAAANHAAGVATKPGEPPPALLPSGAVVVSSRSSGVSTWHIEAGHRHSSGASMPMPAHILAANMSTASSSSRSSHSQAPSTTDGMLLHGGKQPLSGAATTPLPEMSTVAPASLPLPLSMSLPAYCPYAYPSAPMPTSGGSVTETVMPSDVAAHMSVGNHSAGGGVFGGPPQSPSNGAAGPMLFATTWVRNSHRNRNAHPMAKAGAAAQEGGAAWRSGLAVRRGMLAAAAATAAANAPRQPMRSVEVSGATDAQRLKGAPSLPW